jgi:hypothetical protein
LLKKEKVTVSKKCDELLYKSRPQVPEADDDLHSGAASNAPNSWLATVFAVAIATIFAMLLGRI